MNLSQILIIFYVACGLLYCIFQIYLSLRVMGSVPLIKDLSYTGFTTWPKLSVIVTACNEAKTIAAAVQTRLQDNYPNLEIILVDDRSTDGTSEIADQLAGADPRVKVIHNHQLPEGWLGKLYAMDLGVKNATGDWYLFSDADVHIKPDTLKRVIAYCESRGLDHLAVFPEIWPVEFFLDTVLAFFVRMISLGGRIWAIENPRSKVSVGSGAFNLVRRTAFEKTPGFEWLKLETVDDAALGQMLKKAGARGSLANGRDYVGVYFYHSLREMAIASERPFYTLMGNFSGLRLALFGFILLGVELAPFLTLFLSQMQGTLLWVGLIFTACAILNSILVNRWLRRPILPAIFIPIGAVLMAFIIFRAAILGAKRQGVIWRGTFYPNTILKAGKRYEI